MGGEPRSQVERVRAGGGAPREANPVPHELATALLDGIDQSFALHEILCDAAGRPVDYRFLYVNPAFSEASGLGPEIVGRTAREVLPGIEPFWIETYGEVALSGARKSFEHYSEPLDQHYRVCAFSPRRGLFAVLFTNITRRLRAQEEVERLQEVLERRVQQLEAANHELEAFTYSVSHDLRSPLRAIHGFSRMLEEDFGETLDLEARRYLSVVCDNAQKMGRLIDDLLAFSRLGRKPFERRPIDFAALVRQGYAALEEERAGRSVELVIDELPPCEGDPVLLLQVLLNLLSNALKYSRDREPAIIGVGSLQEDGETVYFVRDNGVGFDMRYADKLFGVFQRLHHEHEFDGTGVGLALVQRIVHRHGGRVWAEATPGAGAAFFFTLPPGPGAAPQGERGP